MKTLAIISFAVLMMGLSSSDLDSLLKAEQEFSKALMARGAEEAFSSYMARDVTLLAPGARIIEGKEAARAHIAKEPATALSKWNTLMADTSIGGDFGYTAGAYEFGGGAKTDQAVYLFFWKKESGAWKIACVLRNPMAEPQAVTARRAESVDAAIKSAAPPKPADVEAANAAIIKADTDFSNLSVETNPLVAFSKYIADDGTMIGAITQGLRGRRAVETQFPPSSRKSVLVWRPVKAEMSMTADFGYTIGLSEYKSEGESGKSVTRHGKYLTVWKKQPDGSWKFVLDGGNSTPPPEEVRR